jgi:hypothetical protein
VDAPEAAGPENGTPVCPQAPLFMHFCKYQFNIIMRPFPENGRFQGKTPEKIFKISFVCKTYRVKKIFSRQPSTISLTLFLKKTHIEWRRK